jgi:hypothetical protein
LTDKVVSSPPPPTTATTSSSFPCSSSIPGFCYLTPVFDAVAEGISWISWMKDANHASSSPGRNQSTANTSSCYYPSDQSTLISDSWLVSYLCGSGEAATAGAGRTCPIRFKDALLMDLQGGLKTISRWIWNLSNAVVVGGGDE